MEHRTYGETSNCQGCRYWSELIAKLEAGTVVAMCINSNSAESGKYKPAWANCGNWESGHYGAIDSPGEAEEIQALYSGEDSTRRQGQV